MYLQTGDIVRLKSGGPELTVVSLHMDNGTVECSWFEGEALKQAHFPIEAVREYVEFVEGVY